MLIDKIKACLSR